MTAHEVEDEKDRQEINEPMEGQMVIARLLALTDRKHEQQSEDADQYCRAEQITPRPIGHKKLADKDQLAPNLKQHQIGQGKGREFVTGGESGRAFHPT